MRTEEESSDSDAWSSAAPPFTSASWTVAGLIAMGRNVEHAVRMSALQSSAEEIARIVRLHEGSGVPLVISDLDKMECWNSELLSPEWVLQNHGREG